MAPVDRRLSRKRPSVVQAVTVQLGAYAQRRTRYGSREVLEATSADVTDALYACDGNAPWI